MSLTATGKNGNVFASSVVRTDGPFRCGYCNNDMILRKPRIRIDHFAHYPDTLCKYSEGETYDHLFSKQCIYNSLVTNGISATLEENIGRDARADILIRYGGDCTVAIELQRSKITLDECIARTRTYTSHHIPVLWVGVRKIHDGEETHFSTQERLFHGMYYGILPVYNPYGYSHNEFVDRGSTIKLWKFENVERHHEGYEGDDYHQGYDDYTYTLKTIKIPRFISYTDIARKDMFKVQYRKQWNTIPGGLIFSPIVM